MYIFVNIIGIWYILAKLITSSIVLIWNFLGNKLWTFTNKSHINLEFNAVYDYSILIPAFNEENRIKNTINSVFAYIKENQLSAEVIVINDGSKDKTSFLIKELQKTNQNLVLIDLLENNGKGNAIKEGIMSSKSNFVLFLDADGSTPIHELKSLKEKLISSNSEIAIGSRYLNGSKVGVRQPLYRVLLGRIGNQLIQLFLIENIKDTQCGFKLFRTPVAKQIFSMQKIKRFAFDMEALLIAKNLGYSIVEVPVIWNDSPQSRFRPILDAVRTLRDLVIIKLNLWSGRYELDNKSTKWENTSN
jgi:glycosyltransferase involved in cell wall biosynthesis